MGCAIAAECCFRPTAEVVCWRDQVTQMWCSHTVVIMLTLMQRSDSPDPALAVLLPVKWTVSA